MATGAKGGATIAQTFASEMRLAAQCAAIFHRQGNRAIKRGMKPIHARPYIAG